MPSIYERVLAQKREELDREIAEANERNAALAHIFEDYLKKSTLTNPLIADHQPIIRTAIKSNQGQSDTLELSLEWGKTKPTPSEKALIDQKGGPFSGKLRGGQPSEILAEDVRFVSFKIKDSVISVHTKPEETQNGLPQTLNEVVYKFDTHIKPENSQQELENLDPESLFSYGKYKDNFLHVSLPEVVEAAIMDPFQHQVVYEKNKSGTYSEKKADVASRAA